MSDTLESLRRKMEGARELSGVVRAMKSLAASSIGQYEKSVQSIEDYYRAVELGLAVCLRKEARIEPQRIGSHNGISAVVFGSDQGLVGQFNHVLADFVANKLRSLPGEKNLWVVGERLQACLADAGLATKGVFPVPNSVQGITPLLEQILLQCETHRDQHQVSELHLFHNQIRTGNGYEPLGRQLLPLDDLWQISLTNMEWPTGALPEALGGHRSLLKSLVHEYLFVSLFQASAQSLASENASRLVAMQRAEKNIDEIMKNLNHTFHHLRQSAIDEELFDVISGFEALTQNRGESPTSSPCLLQTKPRWAFAKPREVVTKNSDMF